MTMTITNPHGVLTCVMFSIVWVTLLVYMYRNKPPDDSVLIVWAFLLSFLGWVHAVWVL